MSIVGNIWTLWLVALSRRETESDEGQSNVGVSGLMVSPLQASHLQLKF